MLFLKKNKGALIRLFNTATREKEAFVPLKSGHMKMYSCGPTVYDYVHIGNLRSFVFSDIVRRTFEHAGYEVKQVMNITDFGHLAGDADDTEDKMMLALRREGMEVSMENMFALANTYIQAFRNDLGEMNIKTPHALPRASEHVRGMMAYVEVLLDKGFAYATSDGVYFDTARFPRYGVLGGSASEAHARVALNSEKRDPRDFALWKFSPDMGWDAPWGRGFPGWHIECTAMSTHFLGKTFDIHTGGIDHIAVHHNNELAQAETANNKPYARYWLHNEFVTIDNTRIGKSEGNAITLKQLADKGVSALSYRYWLLSGHYRQKVNFTWEAVEGAQTALNRAWRLFMDLAGNGGAVHEGYRARFEAAIYDDLNTAEAIAVLWELLKDESVRAADKRTTIIMMDRVLGVGFGTLSSRRETLKVAVVSEAELPVTVQELLRAREAARQRKDFAEADRLRGLIQSEGYAIEDGPEGAVVKRI